MRILTIILALMSAFFIGIGLALIVFLLEIMFGHTADLAVLPWPNWLSLSLFWGVTFLLLFTGLLLAAFSKALKLLIAIENNTRLTLLQLMRLHRWSGEEQQEK